MKVKGHLSPVEQLKDEAPHSVLPGHHRMSGHACQVAPPPLCHFRPGPVPAEELEIPRLEVLSPRGRSGACRQEPERGPPSDERAARTKPHTGLPALGSWGWSQRQAGSPPQDSRFLQGNRALPQGGQRGFWDSSRPSGSLAALTPQSFTISSWNGLKIASSVSPNRV